MAKPAAGHAANFVNAPIDKEQLLLADPALVMHQPPEHAQLFEQQIQLDQQGGFGGFGSIEGAHGQHQRVKGGVVESLAEGEPVAFGKVGRAVKRPASEFGQGGVDGWFVVHHLRKDAT